MTETKQPDFTGLKIIKVEPGYEYEWVSLPGFPKPKPKISRFRRWLGDKLLDWATTVDPGIMF